jgi:REP element-mobilizing transposase RayT
MPRQARLDAPGTLHHVIIRGIERRLIVRGQADRTDFVWRLGRLAVETETGVYAWALMKNHAHLMLRSSASGLPHFMRRLLTGYAIAFNQRHRRFGHLFQNRYKSIICEEDAYFKELLRYIHLNPLRAGAVKGLSELDRYRWSGHAVVVGKIVNDWQDRDYVLRWFGRRQGAAIRAYRDFVASGLGQGRRPELVGGGLIRSAGGWSAVKALRRRGMREKGDERILGSSDFVLQVVQEADRRLQYHFPLAERIGKAEQLLSSACQQAGISAEALRTGGRRREMSGLRMKLAQTFLNEMGLSLAEAGRLLGVSSSAIAHSLNRRDQG